LKNNYAVLKLKTNETLFVELLDVGELIKFINPFVVIATNDGTLSLSEWNPFTDNEVHSITSDICYYSNTLNSKFVKFYGSVILQSEINRIKEDVYNTMEDRNDYYTMYDGIERMKRVTKELTEKYGLDSNSIDFSVFEDKLKEHKPTTH
jgi:hypothetical protein